MTWTEIKEYALSERVDHHHLAMVEACIWVRAAQEPLSKTSPEKTAALAAVDKLHQKYPDFVRALSHYEDAILLAKRRSEQRGI
jgi:hypothetical protein